MRGLRRSRAGAELLSLVGSFFTRLTREGRVLGTIVCVGAAFSVDVSRTQSHVLLLAAASLLLASLIFSRGRALTGVVAEARAARRVAVGEELTVTVSIRNEGDDDHGAVRVDPPRLSRDGAWSAPGGTIGRLGPRGRESAVLRARFSRRGEHHLGPFRAAALVPLGLAQGSPTRTEPLRFVVVPKIARVSAVATPRGRRHQPGGVARASSTGDATELLGVRPYPPGDPIRDLHARSWARLGFPVVREYQQEYFTRVGLVLDSDAARASPAHLEAALSLAAGIISRLCQGESLVDMIVVGERVHTLSLGRSLGTVDEALDVLASVRAGPPLAAGPLLARLGPHLDRLSSVVLVALSWDETRAEIVKAIGSRGVGCSAYVVSTRARPEARSPGQLMTPGNTAPRYVPLDAIAGGEELSL